MSSSHNSETQRAVTKAWEGARLLGAGNYEAAIAACTEAIVLEPSMLGAYRTRAEAYERLDRELTLKPISKHIRDRSEAQERRGLYSWVQAWVQVALLMVVMGAM